MTQTLRAERRKAHSAVLRVARPTNDIARLLPFYIDGLGCKILAQFYDHAGFDGVVLGFEGAPYHLEFTRQSGLVAPRAPTEEHLLALYLPDPEKHAAARSRMEQAGFAPVTSSNPYWDKKGVTFEDPDGYRVVLQQGMWSVA
jgi:catechol 2,3-dioxygenase-like lactoylglutathione lyase family enzyme